MPEKPERSLEAFSPLPHAIGVPFGKVGQAILSSRLALFFRFILRRKTLQAGKAGWSWSCVSALNCQGRTPWIADAHRSDGKRFVVHVYEKLTAFMELEAATRSYS